jgi:hypothetical protein
MDRLPLVPVEKGGKMDNLPVKDIERQAKKKSRPEPKKQPVKKQNLLVEKVKKFNESHKGEY